MKVNVYTDGGARGNPGPAAYGFVIYRDKNKVLARGEYIGVTTNNVAEYTAVAKALESLLTFSDCDEVNIFLDSELIQKQMMGEYKVKSMSLKNFFTLIKELEKNFNKVTYTHIRREKNTEADLLVNIALDKELQK